MHKLYEVLVRFEFLLAFRSYLVSIESSQVVTIFTYLGGQSSHKLSPSFIYSSIVISFLLFVSCSCLVFLVSIRQFYFGSFPCSLISHLLTSFSPYNCFFLLPL